MKKPAGKKWDWDDDSSVDDESEDEADEESEDSDSDLKRDKNFASWFKDNEHLLSPEHM